MPGSHKDSSVEKIEEYAKSLVEQGDRDSVNAALLLNHLAVSIQTNAQRDLIIAQMAIHIDELERRFTRDSALHSGAYRSLVGEFRSLQHQQDDLKAQHAVLARVVDIGIEKISAVVRKIEEMSDNLSESIEDLTEP